MPSLSKRIIKEGSIKMLIDDYYGLAAALLALRRNFGKESVSSCLQSIGKTENPTLKTSVSLSNKILKEKNCF